jgi:hypothetical protein
VRACVSSVEPKECWILFNSFWKYSGDIVYCISLSTVWQTYLTYERKHFYVYFQCFLADQCEIRCRDLHFVPLSYCEFCEKPVCNNPYCTQGRKWNSDLFCTFFIRFWYSVVRDIHNIYSVNINFQKTDVVKTILFRTVNKFLLTGSSFILQFWWKLM